MDADPPRKSRSVTPKRAQHVQIHSGPPSPINPKSPGSDDVGDIPGPDCSLKDLRWYTIRRTGELHQCINGLRRQGERDRQVIDLLQCELMKKPSTVEVGERLRTTHQEVEKFFVPNKVLEEKMKAADESMNALRMQLSGFAERIEETFIKANNSMEQVDKVNSRLQEHVNHGFASVVRECGEIRNILGQSAGARGAPQGFPVGGGAGGDHGETVGAPPSGDCTHCPHVTFLLEQYYVLKTELAPIKQLLLKTSREADHPHEPGAHDGNSPGLYVHLTKLEARVSTLETQYTAGKGDPGAPGGACAHRHDCPRTVGHCHHVDELLQRVHDLEVRSGKGTFLAGNRVPATAGGSQGPQAPDGAQGLGAAGEGRDGGDHQGPGGPGGPGGGAAGANGRAEERWGGWHSHTAINLEKLFDDKIANSSDYAFVGGDQGEAWRVRVRGYWISKCPALLHVLNWVEKQEQELTMHAFVAHAHVLIASGDWRGDLDYVRLSEILWGFLNMCLKGKVHDNLRGAPMLNGYEPGEGS